VDTLATSSEYARVRRFPVLVAICVAVCVAGCSSSGDDPGTPTTVARPAGSALSFRPVEAATKAQNGTCSTARRGVTVLSDREHEHCYIVGSALLEHSNLDSAKAVYDDAEQLWVVDVHFTDDEFIDKVAYPMVNKQIAIVADGVVLSAPTVNPGITGREVQISSDFTKAEAEDFAGRLVPPS
jgi:preprotein translocase subunit SecD